MRNKRKWTEIQVHILQKPSIIVERFPLSYCYDTAHAQHTVVDRAVTAWICSMVLWKLIKRQQRVPFLDLLSLIYCLGCTGTVAGVYNMMKTYVMRT